MTDAPVGHGTPEGEEPATAPPPEGSFGEEAAEMANEPFETGAERPPQEPTEVETAWRDADASDATGMPDVEASGDPEPEDDLTRARRDLVELTTDLQRLQAEYLNYKRRVDRDRELIRENATYTALAPITEVLDTIDRAREHAPLEDGFKAVADQLERIVTSKGLTKFGEVGDPFDPTIHEALSHIGEDPDVTVTTCKVIAKAGYRIGERVVRAAQVLVVDPPFETRAERAPQEPPSGPRE
ncbi:MAG: GrpE protein [Nocardioides sp.]|nr:GrpE protein [Nocardioides sp.]